MIRRRRPVSAGDLYSFYVRTRCDEARWNMGEFCTDLVWPAPIVPVSIDPVGEKLAGEIQTFLASTSLEGH